MAVRKIHYNPALVEAGIVEKSRVSICGSITQHSTPQLMVRETADAMLVTCRICRRKSAPPEEPLPADVPWEAALLQREEARLAHHDALSSPA